MLKGLALLGTGTESIAMEEQHDHQREAFLESERVRFPLKQAAARCLMESTEWGPEEITQERQASLREELRRLIDLYPLEDVWDAFINAWDPTRRTARLDTSDERAVPISATDEVQQDFSERIRAAERADVPPDGEEPNTFGLFEPTYQEMLQTEEPRLRDRKFNALLLGSMSEHSADEFRQFMYSVSPKAVTVALDLGSYGLRHRNSDVIPVQADATVLPIESESQDVLCTNFLLSHLHAGDRPPSGTKIVQMLREAYRVLDPEGVLMLVEKAPFARRNYGSSWYSRLLLEQSLFAVGFAGVRSDFTLSYDDHLAKRTRFNEELRYDTGVYTYSIDGGEKHPIIAPFSFATTAKKYIPDRFGWSVIEE